MEDHHTLLGERLNDYRNSETFCDVIVQCDDGTEFPAHRVILAAMSEYFHTSFCGSFMDSNAKVYHLSGVDAKSMAYLLDYFYTGNIKMSTTNIAEILHAADFLLVKQLKDKCKKFLLSDVRSSTLIRYQFLSRQYFDCEVATPEELDGQGVNFYDIFDDDFLLQLSFQQVRQLIQDKSLKHVQEKLLLNFLLKWVEISSDRKVYMLDLFHLVAWEYVPPVYLNKTLDIIYGEFQNHPVTRRILELLQTVNVTHSIQAVHIIRSRAATTVCYAFIPSSDKWVSLAPIPYINISGCVLKTTTLKNKLYVLCCKDQFATRIHGITQSYFLCYEPMLNQWTQLSCPLNENTGEEVCIPAMFLLSYGDSVFYINTYSSTLLHFNPTTSRWKEIKLDCDKFHKDSNMFVKVYDNVLYILGLNVYHCSCRFTLVTLNLLDNSTYQVRLKAYYQQLDGSQIPQNMWQDDCRFRLSSSYKMKFKKRSQFYLYNEYHESVCSVDTEECKLVFFTNKKAQYFSKKSWQALGWSNQVFLASSVDRSCALLDIDTGFWKYVEENPLFPHWTHQAFIMSMLELPPHMADQSSM